MQLPNAQSILSTKQGQLNLHPSLSTQSQQAIVLPQLKSASLISLGQLCDNKCTILLDKKKISVYKDNKVIINGYRNPIDGLWDIPIKSNYVSPPLIASLYKQNQPKYNSIPTFLRKINTITTCDKTKISHKKSVQSNHLPLYLQHLNNIVDDNLIEDAIRASKQENHKLNVIIRKKQSKRQLAQYLHAACLSPTPSTMIQAIKNNNLITWPGLTVNLITKHLPKSIATTQGHLKSEKQGLQSTKKALTPKEELDEYKDFFPASEQPNVRTNQVCYSIIDPSETSISYMDLTG